jgi:hypothetical protein
VPQIRKLWANELTYSIDTVAAQVEIAQEMCKRQTRLLEKYSKLQHTFAEALMELYTHEHKKTAFHHPTDRMTALHGGTLDVLDQIRVTAQAHQQHAFYVESEVLRVSQLNYAEYARRAREAMVKHKQMVDEINNQQQALQKNRAKCVRFISAMDDGGPAEEKSSMNKYLAMAAAAAEGAMSKSSSDPVERTYAALIQYEENIHQTKTFVNK